MRSWRRRVDDLTDEEPLAETDLPATREDVSLGDSSQMGNLGELWIGVTR